MYRSRPRYVRKQNRWSTSSSSSKLVRRNANTFRNRPNHIPNQVYAQTAPKSMKVCMKYSTHIALTNSAGLSADQVFRLNSIFDPDFTGSGHQPQGHDQWNFLYARYRVDSVLIRVIPSAVNAAGFLSLYGSIDSTAQTDSVVPGETPGAITVGTEAGSHTAPIIKHFYPARVLGLTNAQYQSDDLVAAAFGASPAMAAYAHVVFVDRTNTNVSTQTMQVDLTYYVTLFMPQQLARS